MDQNGTSDSTDMRVCLLIWLLACLPAMGEVTLRFSSGTTYTPGVPLKVTVQSDEGEETYDWTAESNRTEPASFHYGKVDKNGVMRYASASLVNAAVCTGGTPVITSVNQATDFGGSTTFAAGSWLEIKGTNLAPAAAIWGSSDFSGTAAPTYLGGVAVSINNKAAFVYYVSANQINVQAPADLTGAPVPIVVTNCGAVSQPYTAMKTGIVPGVLASAKFNIGGRQYAIATLPGVDANGYPNFVGNTNLIPGFTFRPAKPGDTITFYGVGFGDVTPYLAPGNIASGSTQVNASVQIAFGSTPATITYGGLEPNYVGLYQFNVTVPQVADADTLVTFTVNGLPLAQPPFYVTVHH